MVVMIGNTVASTYSLLHSYGSLIVVLVPLISSRKAMLVLVARYTRILIWLQLWVSISLRSTHLELTSVEDSAIYNLNLCGKHVEIVNPANGNSVTVIVADECPTCVSRNSIDLSYEAFKQLADPSVGTFEIKWQYVG